MNINGSQQSATLSNSTDWLHNGRLDYSTPFGMKAGVEFTYYRSPSDQLLNSRLLENDELDFFTQDCQRINRWKMFLAQEHSLGKGWGLNYGMSIPPASTTVTNITTTRRPANSWEMKIQLRWQPVIIPPVTSLI